MKIKHMVSDVIRIIDVVPNLTTKRLVNTNGTSAPIPPIPITAPQTSLVTPRFSINSGILGIQDKAAIPWVKKVSESARRIALTLLSAIFT